MTTLSQSRAIAEAATAFDDLPKWESNAGHLEEGGQCAFGREHRLHPDDYPDSYDEEEARATADAAFIAHFHPARVLQLLEVVEAATSLREMVDNTPDHLKRDWKSIRGFDTKLAAFLKGSE